MKLRHNRGWLPHFTPRRRRILTWCGIVLSVVFIYLYIFGVSAWFGIIEGRNLSGKDDPSLWETPVALKDLSISKAPGRKLSYLGYEFEVPWDDLDEQKTKLVRSWQVIAFHSGKSILFYTSPPSDAERELNRLYGDATVPSGYFLNRAVLEATPGDIGLLTPRGAAARTIVLLLIKSIQVSANEGESGIFLIETKDFHGFQYGNPASRPPQIEADLFADKVHLHFVFPERKHAGFISQAEINRVIQSVRPVHQQASSVDH
ncbi:MAG: hypothetical protein WCE23_00040 [Candidatus Binatus sp.]|uniref:hypothetical protein n=1 Tax=Candidatus Binatus sp. TaxID=2811406 RepID=UPI003C786881